MIATTDTENCLQTQCTNGVGVGCSFNSGQSDDIWSKQELMGVRSDDGQCSSSRHDKPTYLESQALCATVHEKYSLDCYGSKGTSPPNLLKTYESTTQCKDGYAMVDCNSYIEKGIDQCYPNWENYGDSFGGYMEYSILGGMRCIARGSWMYIRAQARCCRIK